MKSYNGFTAAQRSKASRWYKKQLAEGLRKESDICEVCSETQFVKGHSEDYSYPYGDHIAAYSLCYRCHMVIHCRHHDTKFWDTYRYLISAGAKFPTLSYKDFAEIRKMLAGSWPHFELGNFRGRTSLDDINDGLIRKARITQESFF